MTGTLAATGGLAPLAAVAGSVDPAWALQGSVTGRLTRSAARLVGLAVLAGALAAVVALVHRWYTRERVPGGLPVLVGLSGVAVTVGATGVLRQAIGDAGDPFDEAVVLLNVVTMLTGALAARAGSDVGDRVGSDLFVATGAKAVETEVSRVVQAVGRVITVELPEEVDDIVGYDPVPDETKEALAGKTFVFPRRLTVAQLRDRLVTRLKADYAVGHVDVELADDGTVEYLAVGSRAAGIGPTLPPETSAVAIRADPAFAASAGDLVQVWTTDPHERVLTAEIRGKAGDVVTLAVDAADTRKLDDRTEYRLVTLPVETRADREFASLLRAADETMAAVAVAESSALAGQPVGALDVSVAAVRTPGGPVEPLPDRDRLLAGGDTLYLVATPEAIRKVESGARAATASPGATMPPDYRVDAATPVAGSPADATGSRGVRDAPEGPPDGDQSGDGSTDSDRAGGGSADPEAGDSTGEDGGTTTAASEETGGTAGESGDVTDDESDGDAGGDGGAGADAERDRE
ncbi:MAG: potassium transporter TrkA [Haloarculaceae archaeon]